jgi:predicted nucleic-acid-binding Zn-ribbon protein
MQEQPKDEQKATSCPKCGGNMLACQYLGNEVVFIRLGTTLYADRKSSAYALVCDNCGYSEIYASGSDETSRLRTPLPPGGAGDGVREAQCALSQPPPAGEETICKETTNHGRKIQPPGD